MVYLSTLYLISFGIVVPVIICFFQEFLRWFCSSQFDSLFPGASITRRTTALCNLMLMKQVFGFDSNRGMCVLINAHWSFVFH